MNKEFLESLGIEVANEGEEEILFKCPFHDDKNPLHLTTSQTEYIIALFVVVAL